MRKAAVSCWNLVSPFAAGIGLASAAVSFIIGLYYNTMVAWTLLYLFASATSARDRPLPFAVCPAAAATLEAAAGATLSAARNLSGASSGAPANSSGESECQVSDRWLGARLAGASDISLAGALIICRPIHLRRGRRKPLSGALTLVARLAGWLAAPVSRPAQDNQSGCARLDGSAIPTPLLSRPSSLGSARFGPTDRRPAHNRAQRNGPSGGARKLIAAPEAD